MTAHDPPLTLPKRGVAGGYRDPWDGPHYAAEERAKLAESERRITAAARKEGRRWRAEIEAQRQKRQQT